MNKSWSKCLLMAGLMSMGGVALAGSDESAPTAPAAPAAPAGAAAKPAPQEPIGFVAGGVIGAFAAGPLGAVVGAGLGTWLGNRVHRAGEAAKAETEVAALQSQTHSLESEQASLLLEKNELAQKNQSLTVQVAQLSTKAAAEQAAAADPAQALNGLQGDVLFRTGSFAIDADTARQLQVLAEVVSKSPDIMVRIDGYADPRGGVNTNLKLSEARADAVRDLLLAAGVQDQALEVNAYGKTLSVADDDDGYALERRVRLTLYTGGTAVAETEGPAAGPGTGASAGTSASGGSAPSAAVAGAGAPAGSGR